MTEKLTYSPLILEYLRLNNLSKFEIPEKAPFPKTEELPDAYPYTPLTYLFKVSSILSPGSEKLVLNYPIKKSKIYHLDIYCYTRQLGIHLYNEDTYFKLIKKKRVKSIYDLKSKELGEPEILCVTEHKVLLPSPRRYPYLHTIDSLRDYLA